MAQNLDGFYKNFVLPDCAIAADKLVNIYKNVPNIRTTIIDIVEDDTVAPTIDDYKIIYEFFDIVSHIFAERYFIKNIKEAYETQETPKYYIELPFKTSTKANEQLEDLLNQRKTEFLDLVNETIKYAYEHNLERYNKIINGEF